MFSSLIAFVFIFVARWCRSRSPSSQLFVTTSTPCGLHQQCFIILQWAEALRTISPCITCHWGSSVCLRVCDTHHMRLPQVNEFWIFCGTSWCCKRVQSPNDVMQRFSFDLEKWFRQVFVIFFYQLMDEKIKTWTLRFPANRVAVWRQSEVSIDF